MNQRIQTLLAKFKETESTHRGDAVLIGFDEIEKFAELILANADELKREVSTDPINKPFELNPKFVAKCDKIGRSRRQFQ